MDAEGQYEPSGQVTHTLAELAFEEAPAEYVPAGQAICDAEDGQ